jgi:predicted acetyltransferase
MMRRSSARMTTDPFLVVPQARYRDAFLRAAQDHVDASTDPERSREYARALSDFDAYLDELKRYAASDEPAPGFVRQRNYWLIHDDAVVGHLRLRPRLNERLLRLGGHIGYDVPPLQRRRGYATRMLALGVLVAAGEGLHRVLLTADARNAPSIKVIERNGGRFDSEYDFEGVVRRRYWIDVTTSGER